MPEEKKPLEPWTLAEWRTHLYAGFQRGCVRVVQVLMVSAALWSCWGWIVSGVRNGTAAALYLEQAQDLGLLPKPDSRGKVQLPAGRPSSPSPAPGATTTPAPPATPSPSPANK